MTAPGDRKSLRRSLTAGAIYDLALGLFILLAGKPTMAALGSPVPDPSFFFFLGVLPLLILPALYARAASATAIDEFRLPVLWARAGGGGLLIVLTVLLEPPVAWMYLLIGVFDLAWATLHQMLWRAPRH